MSSTERWELWWFRFHERLNSQGTLLGFLLTGATAITSATAGGAWAWVAGFCVVGFTIYLGWLAIKAIPPYLNPQQVQGRKLTLDKLRELPERCVKIALVGIGCAGKTTLLEHLTGLPQTNAQTLSPELVVLTVENVGDLVFLDAAGDDLTQQFELIDHADVLILVLDHNEKRIARVSSTRKQHQERNIRQLLFKLQQKQKSGRPIFGVHLLYNKQDLWGNCPTPERINLVAWFGTLLSQIQHVLPLVPVSADDHSNQRTVDITKVRNQIHDLAKVVSHASR